MTIEAVTFTVDDLAKVIDNSIGPLLPEFSAVPLGDRAVPRMYDTNSLEIVELVVSIEEATGLSFFDETVFFEGGDGITVSALYERIVTQMAAETLKPSRSGRVL